METTTAIYPPYPGRVARAGDPRRDVVALIQTRLNDLGSGPLEVDGAFGPATRAAVLLFQSRRGLTADGAVGSKSWAALFGASDWGAVTPATTPLAAEVLKVAGREVGVRESGGPNRGPRVDEYLRNVGLDPTRGAYSWCASFVYFCFTRAAADLGVANPCFKTAGVLNLWRHAPEWARVLNEQGTEASGLVRPGALFIVDHGGGKGHTGLVESVDHDSLHTIEGNTDPGGSRDGDGVYRRVRQLSRIHPGFIDYGLAPAARANA
jgi:hypothetical protein